MKELFTSLESSLQPYIQEHGKHFSLHLPAHLPTVFGNPVKLKQAFLNLLKNAFEATDESGCVSLSARKYLDQLIIRISDDGCGMTPEAAAELFTPFASGKTGGTGLGLAITEPSKSPLLPSEVRLLPSHFLIYRDILVYDFI